MNTIIKYVCDYCGAEYYTEQECATCEASHKKFVSLVSQKFERDSTTPVKYPDKLTVELEDGIYAEFGFVRPLVGIITETGGSDDTSDETHDNSDTGSDNTDNSNNSTDTDITGGYAE